MTKTRRLSDLYQVGCAPSFDDGAGEAVTVFMRKLSPVDLETALRRANAKRAKYVLALRDVTSEEYQEVFAANVERLADRDACLEVLVSCELSKHFTAIESEVASEEEWSENDYLQGLRDTWVDFSPEEQESEDPGVVRVRDELRRFNTIVGETIDAKKESIVRSFDGYSDDEVSTKALKELLRVRSENAWLTELRLSELWLSVREFDDHKTLYFKTREEVDELPHEVLAGLLEAYETLTVSTQEGKDLARTQDSSSLSETPSKEETLEVSGPEVVSA